jgi:hypothetical protein
MNKVEEVLKLKQLLDSGHISQDDFEKLKSEIFENENNNNSKKSEVNKTSNNKIIILILTVLFLSVIVYFLVYSKSFSSSNNVNKVQDSTKVEGLLNESNINQQTENNTNSDSENLKYFIGEWRTSIGENVSIKSNNELSISNSVCEASLTCNIKNNELILFFNSVAGKLNNDYSYLTNKEIGKCYNKNNELYIEITNEDMKNSMGFSGGKLLSESEFYKLNE